MYHACVCKERRLTASSVLPLLLLSRTVATLPHQASPRGRPGTQHRHLLHPQAMHRPPGAPHPAAHPRRLVPGADPQRPLHHNERASPI